MMFTYFSTHVEVLGVNLAVLGLVEVLLRDEDTLTEEVLVDLLAVLLWNQPNGYLISACSGDRRIAGALTSWRCWLSSCRRPLGDVDGLISSVAGWKRN